MLIKFHNWQLGHIERTFNSSIDNFLLFNGIVPVGKILLLSTY